jgi:hypothetical protein
MPVTSQHSRSAKSEPQTASSGIYLLEVSAGISREAAQPAPGVDLGPIPLPWRYCALSMLSASALVYGMLYVIAAIL